MANIRLKSDDRMSNRQYHAQGKPTWWARIGDRFIDIPYTRGDDILDAVVVVERHPTQDQIIDYGCGSRSHGVRERMTVRSVARVAAEKAAKAAKATE